MDNKERAIRFVKGFGSVALTMVTLVACAGSLNYGVELAKTGYTMCGAIGLIWCGINIVKAWKDAKNN